MTVPHWIIEIHDHFKTQRMCDEAVRNIPCMMLFVIDHLKTMEICNEIMRIMPEALHRIPDRFKTQEMCKKAVEADPSNLKIVLGHFKSQEMCDKALRDDPFSLQYVPVWFVTREGLYMWYDDYYDGDYWVDDDDKFFNWYNGYQKRKAQKAQIKKELLPIAWHPLRWWDWCMPEHEKKEIQKLWK